MDEVRWVIRLTSQLGLNAVIAKELPVAGRMIVMQEAAESAQEGYLACRDIALQTGLDA